MPRYGSQGFGVSGLLELDGLYMYKCVYVLISCGWKAKQSDIPKFSL